MFRGAKRKAGTYGFARAASRRAYKRRRVYGRLATRAMSAAGTIARYGYRYGGYAAAAGAVGYGAYRLRRRFKSRSRVTATRVPRATISRFFIFGSQGTDEVLQSKRMYPALLPMVNEPEGTNLALHTAKSLEYVLKGFKICATFRNTLIAQPDVGNPVIEVNFMIYQLKDTDPILTTFPNPSDTGKDFFVNSDHTIEERHVNFENRTAYTLTNGIVIPANPTWNAEQICMPVNTDKFNVIYKSKFRLTSMNYVDNATRKCYCKIDKYFPVNKRFAYETKNDLAVRNPIRVLIWYDTMFPRGATFGDGADGGLRVNMNCVGYTKS